MRPCVVAGIDRVSTDLCTSHDTWYIGIIDRPQRYSAYNFITAEIDECLALSHRAIELAEWLSKAALEEFDRFQEFMKWTKVGKYTKLPFSIYRT